MCTLYNLPSFTDKIVQTPTLNVAGRSAYDKVLYSDVRKSNKRFDEHLMPGPGSYQNCCKMMGTEGLKFSLHGRLKSAFCLNNCSPGPGTYEPK